MTTPEEKVVWPEYIMVKVNELALDDRYQRSLNERRVLKIAENFNPDLFGVITVARRSDGSVYVMDGGHRLTAASLVDIEEVPALVSTAESAQHEATNYVEMNTKRKATSVLEAWKAAAFADEGSMEAQANKLLADYGLHLGTGGSPNVIRAAGALKEIMNKGGIPLLHDTLDIIHKHWAGTENCYSDRLMKGVATFLWTYEDRLSFDKVHHALDEELKTVTTVMTPTRILQKVHNLSGAQVKAISDLMLKTYNSKNKTKWQYRENRPTRDIYKGFIH